MTQEIISKVWQISGLIGSVIPGLLIYKKEEVSFLAYNEMQFKVRLEEIKNVKWPFLRMGLGFDAVVNGKKYKFSFTKPIGARIR